VPTPSLHELQQLFWKSLAVRPSRDSIAPGFLRIVGGADDVDRKIRIGIYSEAYYLRLRDVLREDFARLAALIGAEQFDEVVAGYLEAYPSEQPSVRHLGRALAPFLRIRKDTPKCLAELAELEWARVEVFDALDANCATIADLTGLPPEVWPRLCFSTIPALQTLRTQFPVHQLWSGDKGLDLSAAETSIRIWRKNDFQVLHAPMDERESAALQKMISRLPFAEICETFADLPPLHAAKETTALLARWFEDRIVARIDCPV
jgi:hypothetical protein